MGWVESMYIFCAASETTRDVGQQLLEKNHLPPHKLEDIILPDEIEEVKSDDFDPAEFLRLIEVYVDDFIAIVQVRTMDELRHVSRALLYGIDSIFPDGVSLSKLHKEGKWSTVKEILG